MQIGAKQEVQLKLMGMWLVGEVGADKSEDLKKQGF